MGGLKKVLSNVKDRGTWGEYQIGDLLTQILAPEQFGEKVNVNPNHAGQVEYAVKLPGKDSEETVWLPIDSKFPMADYERLCAAVDNADKEAVNNSATALEKKHHPFRR